MQTTDDILFSAHGPDPIPTATTEVVGTPGNALNVYWIVSHFPIGSVVSGPFPQKSAPNVLDDENYVHISWLPTLGALSYDLLFTRRLELPKQPGNFALALNLTDTEFRDTGQSLSEYDLAGIRYGAPQQEWIFFDNRDRKQPTLRFIPWPIEVSSIIFEDGTSLSTAGAAGGAAPPDQSIQFNDDSAFGGSPNLLWNDLNNFMFVQGHVGIGDPNPVVAKLSVVNDSGAELAPAGIDSARYSDDTVPPIFYSFKARGTLASRQPVQINDELLYLGYGGFVPGFLANHGAITAVVQGNIQSSDIVFFTNDGTDNTLNSNGFERMRITGTGNVGINTNNPRAALDTSTIFPAAGAHFGYSFGSPSSGLWIFPAAGRSLLWGGTFGNFEELDIDAYPLLLCRQDQSSGLVGIGVSNPQYKLDVFSSINISVLATAELPPTQPGPANSWSLSFSNLTIPASDQRVARISVNTESFIDSGVLMFQTANAGVLSEKMRITSAGNVGIGTQNPQQALDVNGVIGTTYGLFGANGLIINAGGNTLQLLYGVSDTVVLSQGLADFSTTLVRVFGGFVVGTSLTVETNGNIEMANLPSTSPGPGSKRIWYDPTDGNIVKFAA